MILPCLIIAPTATMGRGVFTTENIEAGTLIEVSPVIVMSATERKLLDQTLLHDYIFEWGEERDQCCMALGYIQFTITHMKVTVNMKLILILDRSG